MLNAQREAGQDAVHDAAHVYRVLYTAMQLTKKQPQANKDVVILAALLHDIGRTKKAAPLNAGGKSDEKKQTMPKAKVNKEGHAQRGAAMAYKIVLGQGFSKNTAAHVRSCVQSHSYSQKCSPQSIEAKIIYDADKLDLSGALGCARAILYGKEIGEPIYLLGQGGRPQKASKKGAPSLLREYKRKLKNLHKVFYTGGAKKIAKKRQKVMNAWFKNLEKEIYTGYNKGAKLLDIE